VAEAAVVGKPHDIKGEAVFAFVVCRGPRPTGDTSKLVQELRNWVGEQVGAIAKPEDIRFADNLPKTRSGKIMRRLLRSIARDEEISQDVSTLENPAILDQLRGVDAGPASAKPAAAKKMPAAKKSAAAKKAPAGKKSAAAKVARDNAARKKSGKKKVVATGTVGRKTVGKTPATGRKAVGKAARKTAAAGGKPAARKTSPTKGRSLKPKKAARAK
jgi:hypothetical protein